MIYFLIKSDAFDFSEDVIHPLENLAYAGSRGNQYVLGDRSVLDRLAMERGLSDSARTYYRRASQAMTQLGAWIDRFHRIDIDIRKLDGVVVDNVVPLGFFSNASYCEKSQLLTEDITDFRVLTGLAKVFLKKLGGAGIGLNLRGVNGGGANTAKIYAHLDKDPSGPVCCVVDSDRHFHGDGLGSTAISCSRAARKVKDSWRLFFSSLDSRELENIIPFDLKRECSLALERDVIDQLDIMKGVDKYYLDFCSFKDGDTLCRMIADATKKGRNEVVDELKKVKSLGLHECGGCVVDPDYKCFKSPALGRKFLERLSDRLEQDDLSVDLATWSHELHSLVVRVVSFGISPVAMRV